MTRAGWAAGAAIVAAGGVVAWWMLGREPVHVGVPRTAPTDDLDLVVSLLDGATTEPPHDLLVAGGGALYLAHASDRRVLAFGADAGPGRTLATLDEPARGMAIAADSLWLTTGHDVRRLPTAGGAPTAVATGLAQPRALACDGTWLFVVDVAARAGRLTAANEVVRIPVAGGERLVLGRSEGEIPGLALDDASVYWADRLEGTLVAVAKSGGPVRVLASDRGLPGPVVADGDALYWAEKRGESLWTMPRSGGPPRGLAQDFAGFANLVVTARDVAWSPESAVDGAFRVLSVAKTGGDVTPVSPPVDSIDALASDGAHLYWSRAGTVTALR